MLHSGHTLHLGRPSPECRSFRGHKLLALHGIYMGGEVLVLQRAGVLGCTGRVRGIVVRNVTGGYILLPDLGQRAEGLGLVLIVNGRGAH